MIMIYQVFLSNTNNLYTPVWFQITTIAHSAGAVEYTDCFSAEGVRLPFVSMSVLDMTLNNLMMRL